MSGLVCLRRYYDPEEAVVVRSALGAAGIDSHLLDTALLAVDPTLRIGLGGYRLSVLAQDEIAARQALVEIESYKTDEPVGADTTCPTCGGACFRRRRSLRWTIVAILCGYIPFVAQNHQSQCISCGEIVKVDHRTLPVRLFFHLLSLALIALMISVWLTVAMRDTGYR